MAYNARLLKEALKNAGARPIWELAEHTYGLGLTAAGGSFAHNAAHPCDCPFCGSGSGPGRSSAFSISQDGMGFTCRGRGGEKGDVLDFVCRMEGVSLNQACEFIAEAFPQVDFSGAIDDKYPTRFPTAAEKEEAAAARARLEIETAQRREEERIQRERLEREQKANRRLSRAYIARAQVETLGHEAYRSYVDRVMESRGFLPGEAEKFGVAFDPDYRMTMPWYRSDEDGWPAADRSRRIPALIIPYAMPGHKTNNHYFQAKPLAHIGMKKLVDAKYIKPKFDLMGPEPVYNAGTVWGSSKEDVVFVVEGIFDALSLRAIGADKVIMSGTNLLPAAHLAAFRDSAFSGCVCIIADDDEKGREGAARSKEQLEAAYETRKGKMHDGIPCYVTTFTEVNDSLEAAGMGRPIKDANDLLQFDRAALEEFCSDAAEQARSYRREFAQAARRERQAERAREREAEVRERKAASDAARRARIDRGRLSASDAARRARIDRLAARGVTFLTTPEIEPSAGFKVRLHDDPDMGKSALSVSLPVGMLLDLDSGGTPLQEASVGGKTVQVPVNKFGKPISGVSRGIGSRYWTVTEPGLVFRLDSGYPPRREGFPDGEKGDASYARALKRHERTRANIRETARAAAAGDPYTLKIRTQGKYFHVYRPGAKRSTEVVISGEAMLRAIERQVDRGRKIACHTDPSKSRDAQVIRDALGEGACELPAVKRSAAVHGDGGTWTYPIASEAVVDTPDGPVCLAGFDVTVRAAMCYESIDPETGAAWIHPIVDAATPLDIHYIEPGMSEPVRPYVLEQDGSPIPVSVTGADLALACSEAPAPSPSPEATRTRGEEWVVAQGSPQADSIPGTDQARFAVELGRVLGGPGSDAAKTFGLSLISLDGGLARVGVAPGSGSDQSIKERVTIACQRTFNRAVKVVFEEDPLARLATGLEAWAHVEGVDRDDLSLIAPSIAPDGSISLDVVERAGGDPRRAEEAAALVARALDSPAPTGPRQTISSSMGREVGPVQSSVRIADESDRAQTAELIDRPLELMAASREDELMAAAAAAEDARAAGEWQRYSTEMSTDTTLGHIIRPQLGQPGTGGTPSSGEGTPR